MSDPDVMRWVGTGPVTDRAQTQAMLREYAEHQTTHGFSFWAVLERDTRTVIGDAGLYNGEAGTEVGYTLAANKWGLGYGTELARKCVQVASEEFGLEELVATVRPEHPASAAVLAKTGFRKDGHISVYGARPTTRAQLAASPPHSPSICSTVGADDQAY